MIFHTFQPFDYQLHLNNCKFGILVRHSIVYYMAWISLQLSYRSEVMYLWIWKFRPATIIYHEKEWNYYIEPSYAKPAVPLPRYPFFDGLNIFLMLPLFSAISSNVWGSGTPRTSHWIYCSNLFIVNKKDKRLSRILTIVSKSATQKDTLIIDFIFMNFELVST